MDIQATKLGEMENRSRRNNVRVIGLPERSGGPNPITFLEGWFREIFGPTTFTPLFAIERAHRQAGDHPRPLLLKLLNYNDKVTLLQMAREAGDIKYNRVRVSLYPDFSPDLQKRRVEFIPIKRTLQKYKDVYALLYTARLRVTALGGTVFFNSPADVTQWLEENKKDL